VVAAFARAILKEVNGEMKKRPITKMLGKGYLEGENVAGLLTDLIADLSSTRAAVIPIKKLTSVGSE
jgi:hypothetical protein